MDLEDSQREIAAIQGTLNEARDSPALGPNDPAVIELERIMLSKIAELKALKTEARDAFFAQTEDEGPDFASAA
jgi:hypothetical protein